MGIGTAGLGIPQDMLAAMSCSIVTSKIVDEAFNAGNAIDAFNAATIGGAKTLGRQDIGRITEGAKADLLLFDLNTIRMSPVRDHRDHTDQGHRRLGGPHECPEAARHPFRD